MLEGEAKTAAQLALSRKRVEHISKLKAEAARVSVVAKLQAERNEDERRALWLLAKAVLKEQLRNQAAAQKRAAQDAAALQVQLELIEAKAARQKARKYRRGEVRESAMRESVEREVKLKAVLAAEANVQAERDRISKAQHSRGEWEAHLEVKWLSCVKACGLNAPM
jgi:hypothetical protein